jgi:hypothetical protein
MTALTMTPTRRLITKIRNFMIRRAKVLESCSCGVDRPYHAPPDSIVSCSELWQTTLRTNDQWQTIVDRVADKLGVERVAIKWDDHETKVQDK